jgi:hypothetical protein
MKTRYVFLVVLSLSLSAQGADLFDLFGVGKKPANQADNGPATLTSPLSQDQMIGGLKEALGKGVQQAVSRLGHDGGFLTNLNVRIPMPEKLKTVERTLRLLKQDKMADEFVATMNHAAEQAVPAAADVFTGAVKNMSFDDARSILTGTNNAATQYFRRTTETNLFERFLPIVKKATDQTGVTAAYKQLMEKVEGADSFGGFGRTLLGGESVDLDGYVTHKALDGLFFMVAEEEKKIRENPIARTTDLLQQVFGAITRQPQGH